MFSSERYALRMGAVALALWALLAWGERRGPREVVAWWDALYDPAAWDGRPVLVEGDRVLRLAADGAWVTSADRTRRIFVRLPTAGLALDDRITVDGVFRTVGDGGHVEARRVHVATRYGAKRLANYAISALLFFVLLGLLAREYRLDLRPPLVARRGGDGETPCPTS